MTNDDDEDWSGLQDRGHEFRRRVVLDLDETRTIWWALFTFANDRPRDRWARTRSEKVLAKITALKDALEGDREKAVRRERRASNDS